MTESKMVQVGATFLPCKHPLLSKRRLILIVTKSEGFESPLSTTEHRCNTTRLCWKNAPFHLKQFLTLTEGDLVVVDTLSLFVQQALREELTLVEKRLDEERAAHTASRQV